MDASQAEAWESSLQGVHQAGWLLLLLAQEKCTIEKKMCHPRPFDSLSIIPSTPGLNSSSLILPLIK